MASRLEQLLDSLDPDRTLNEVARRADEAINTFPSPGSQITDWDEFFRCLARFHQHLDARILRLREEVRGAEEFYRGRCVHLLTQAFGPRGDKAAFEMARTGAEGGLYAVLKRVAQAVVGQYAENELGARVGHYWNELSTEEKLAAPDEYLRRYGHLLPSELTEGGAGRIRADFPKVLREHPRIIQRLRQIGRT